MIDAATASDRLRPHILHLIDHAQKGMGAGNFGDMETTGEARLVRAAAQVLPAGTVLDIGANDGRWASLALAAFPTSVVIAVEPGRAAFERMEHHLGGSERIRLVHAALSDRSGTGTLYGGSGLGEFASLHLDLLNEAGFLREVDEMHAEEVELLTVEDLIDQYGERDRLGHITMAKVDTEGSEFEVLSHLVRSKPDIIQFEFGTYSLMSGKPLNAFAELLGADYRLKRLSQRSLVDQRQMSPEEMNYFGYSNWCAVRTDLDESLVAAYHEV